MELPITNIMSTCKWDQKMARQSYVALPGS
jgi:hypothetical protein